MLLCSDVRSLRFRAMPWLKGTNAPNTVLCMTMESGTDPDLIWAVRMGNHQTMHHLFPPYFPRPMKLDEMERAISY